MERIAVVVVITVLPVLIVVVGLTWGQGDVDEHEFEAYLDSARKNNFLRILPVVTPVTHEVYNQNCSDCHWDYSPDLLPIRSWEKLMTVEALENHFEEYIYLEEEERQDILNYLVTHAAEKSDYKLATKIIQSIPGEETPIRIREVRAIYRRHDIIPEKYITGNEKVISLSQCSACHQQVGKGVLDEDDVYIPFVPLVQSEQLSK